MGQWLQLQDLAVWIDDIPAEQGEALIDQAEAMAQVLAPCLMDAPSPVQVDAAKGILVTAIRRWYEVGTGMVTQQSTGSASVTYDQRARPALFWPSEIVALRRICDSGAGKAFMINPTQPRGVDPFASRPDLRFQWGWPGVAE